MTPEEQPTSGEADRILAQLLTDPAFLRDATVHAFVTAWRLGHVSGKETLRRLVQSLWAQKCNVTGQLLKALQYQPPNPVAGHVGEPDASGRAEIALTDEGKQLYGPHARLFTTNVQPAADEPTIVGEAR